MSQELGSTLWLQDPGCKTFTLWPDASFLVWTDPGPDLVLSETNHNTVTSNIIDQHDPRAFLDDKTVEVKAWQTHCQLQVLVWGEQPHPKYYIHWNFQIKILRIFHLQSSYCASQWTRYSLSTTPHALRDTTLLRTAWQNDFVALGHYLRTFEFYSHEPFQDKLMFISVIFNLKPCAFIKATHNFEVD